MSDGSIPRKSRVFAKLICIFFASVLVCQRTFINYDSRIKSQSQEKPLGGIKMIRRIIQIDQEKCNGCGACAEACHEGAITMVDGKARLLRDDYCDGLGNCLPVCPTGAITFEEREAAAYDEAAVQAHKASAAAPQHTGGCPGSRMRQFDRQAEAPAAAAGAGLAPPLRAPSTSRLTMRPCGPEPLIDDRSTPFWAARRRASGDEKMRAPFCWDAVPPPGAAFAAPPSPPRGEGESCGAAGAGLDLA